MLNCSEDTGNDPDIPIEELIFDLQTLFVQGGRVESVAGETVAQEDTGQLSFEISKPSARHMQLRFGVSLAL